MGECSDRFDRCFSLDGTITNTATGQVIHQGPLNGCLSDALGLDKNFGSSNCKGVASKNKVQLGEIKFEGSFCSCSTDLCNLKISEISTTTGVSTSTEAPCKDDNIEHVDVLRCKFFFVLNDEDTDCNIEDVDVIEGCKFLFLLNKEDTDCNIEDVDV